MITETNVTTGIRTTRDYTAKELADIEASKPTPAQIAEAAKQTARAAIAAINAASASSILTWIASQAGGLGIGFLKAQEALAVIERNKLT